MTLPLRPALLPHPALRPDPGTAEDWLRAELARAEYQPTLWERVQGWLDEALERVARAGEGLGGLGWPVLLVIVLVLLGLVALALARLQRSSVGSTEQASVFGEVRRSAVDHRRLAEAAQASGEWETSVLEGIRWLAADLAERRVTADDPGITTREVSTTAAPRFPEQAARLDAAVRTFEEVRYGGRSADRGRAEAVLAIVGEVSATAPVAAQGGPYLAVPR